MTDPAADATQLKRCPFCGCPVSWVEINGAPFIECLCCDLRYGPTGQTKAAIGERWNLRPQPAPCAHEWETLQDGSVGCRKCLADKSAWEATQPAPPEGEPDFEKLTQDHWREYERRLDDDGGENLPGTHEEHIFREGYRLGLVARPKVEDAGISGHDEAMARACIHSWDQNPLADHVGIDGSLLKRVAKLYLRVSAKLAEREAELAKAKAMIEGWKRHAARQQQKAPAEKDKP